MSRESKGIEAEKNTEYEDKDEADDHLMVSMSHSFCSLLFR